MKTFEDYKERLFKMKNNVYVEGKIISRDDPVLETSLNVIKETFKAAEDPELSSLVVVESNLTGEKINRFTHLHQSVDDLLKKQEMTRKLCHKVGGCIQRCMAADALNAIGIVTKEIDDKNGTEYNKNFLNFMRYFQTNNMVANAAQSDVKGDRSKRPSQQEDLDLYLRVVEKRPDGIVVRGAKAHNSSAPYCDEIIVLPTRYLTEEESDWAVSFAIPADTEGIKMICRLDSPKQRMELMAPGSEFGIAESLTIFDNVFVPWERVFMCGESEFGARLALLFANYHRHSYCGCKPAVTDVMMGLTALAAEYNGIPKASHIVDDVTELMILAELVYAAGIASSVKANRTSSGIYEPEFLYSNTGRYLAGKNIFHEYEILASASGGWPATMPFEEDWLNPETRGYLHKYIMRNPAISSENQHRLWRFISDVTASNLGGVWQYAGIHGGGTPIMEKIGVRSQYNLKEKIDIVKRLAGIKDDV